MHGKDAIVEEVLDWRPSDYFTVSTLLPIPGAPKIMMTHAFQGRTNGATHIEMRVAKPKPKDKAFVDQAGAKFKENITKAIGNLRLMLEEQQTSLSVDRRTALDCLERAVPDRASEIKHKLNDWLYALVSAETLRRNSTVAHDWS